MNRNSLVYLLLFLFSLSLFVQTEDITYPPNFLGSLRHEKQNFPLHYEDNHENMERFFENATLIASPSIIQNGGSVQVEWKGINGATRDDWIAVFCGEPGSDSNYLDYLYTNSIRDVGSVWFQGLINLRCDYSFRYYHGQKNKSGRYPLAAISNKVTIEGGNNAPTQVHISRTENATQIGITWISGSNQNGGVVEYGLSPDNLNLRSNTTSANTYNATDMCGAPANVTSQQLFRDPGFIHYILLENLSPNTKYYYRVGNEEEGFTNITWFLSAQSTEEKSTKIVVYGDMGVWAAPASLTTAERVAAEVEENGAQLLLHIGDISYALGYAYVWDQFFTVIEPIAAHIPYMINIGNHEYDHTSDGQNDPSGAQGNGFHPSWGDYGDDSNGECSVPVYYRFPYQVFPSNGHGIYWYSFDNGPVHVIMISTEHNYTKGSDQYEWIENDLKGVDRSVTPFIIFGGHRPMYCSELLYVENYKVVLGMRKSFEDLLFSYSVDLAVWGHNHSYGRTCPVYKGECNDEGTTHIVVGTAGAGLDNPSAHVDVKWSRKYIVEFGYMTIEVNENQMTCKFILNTTGEIADQFTLYSRF